MTDEPTHVARAVRRQVWRAHPVLAVACSAAAVVVPVVVGVLATQVVADVLPRPVGTAATVAFFVLVALTAVSATLLTERITRELAPLAALLRLTLVFPDRAPQRYRVALRARTSRKLELEDRLARSETPAESADVLLQLVAKLSRHDRLTRGHSERVRAYTDLLTEQLSLTDEDAARLRWAALLHDVGKLAVPARILNKPGRLTDDEFAVIMKHPERGAYLAEPLAAWLGDWIRSIGEHHERWDGNGYPGRLAGDDIALGARIVAVADAFDVMTSFRTYANRRSLPDARRELVDCAGGQFDPKIVRAMLQISLPRLAMVCGPLAVIASIPLVGRRTAGALDALARSTHGSATAISGSEVSIAMAGTVLGASLILSGISPVVPERAEVAAPPALVVGAAQPTPVPAVDLTHPVTRRSLAVPAHVPPEPSAPGRAAPPRPVDAPADPAPPPAVETTKPTTLPAPVAPAADTASEAVAPLTPPVERAPTLPVPTPPSLGGSGGQDAGGGAPGVPAAPPLPSPDLDPPPVATETITDTAGSLLD